jgi:transposase
VEKPDQYLTPFQRKLLQKSLQEDLPKSYRQRLQIMLMASEGKSQTEICQTLGCCPATVRHWMHIARAGMAHQWQDCPIGRPKAVNDEYLERLKELLTSSPRDYGYSFRRWTVNWLTKQLAKEFGVEVSDRSIKRLLKQMGLSTVPKPSNTDKNRNESANSSKILIRDLNSSNDSHNNEFLPINLALLGTDSDIHGAKSIRAVTISATTEQYTGVFSFPSRMGALS